jgi:hypothetical protein
VSAIVLAQNRHRELPTDSDKDFFQRSEYSAVDHWIGRLSIWRVFPFITDRLFKSTKFDIGSTLSTIATDMNKPTHKMESRRKFRLESAGWKREEALAIETELKSLAIAHQKSARPRSHRM